MSETGSSRDQYSQAGPGRAPSVKECSTEPDDSTNCGIFGRGHLANPTGIRVQAGHPWRWRDGVVTSIWGLSVHVSYVLEGGSILCWHHRDLAGELAVGSPVRVYEPTLLDTGNGWISVRTEGGLGAVDEPAQPELWTSELPTTIIDMQAGRGIVVDRPHRA